MLMSFDTLLRKFISKEDKIVKLILIHNFRYITDTLKDSFDRNEILISKINFLIKIDILVLYDQHPLEFIQLNFYDFNSIEKIIERTLKALVGFIFYNLGYKEITFLKELYNYTLSVTSFPIDVFPQNFIKEQIILKDNGFSKGEIQTKKFKYLTQYNAIQSFYKSELQQLYNTLFCTNEFCTSPIVSINTEEISYIIEINTKTITKTIVKSNCSTCSSALNKRSTNVQRNSFYRLNIQENDDCSDNFNLKVTINGIDNLEKSSKNEIFENMIVLGYYERNKRGNWEFRIISRLILTNINQSDLIEQKISLLKASSLNRLKMAFKLYVPHKVEITTVDLRILTILNILNCNLQLKIDNEMFILSSPTSANILEDTENTKLENISRKNIVIYTNDVNYVVYIIRAISVAKVFYSLKSFKKYSSYYKEAICILDINDKLKNTESLDLEFWIEVGKECIYDYSYERIENSTKQSRSCSLTGIELVHINSIFTEQRKYLKSIVEPYKLLKRIEAVALSLKDLTGDPSSLKLIEKEFIKTLYL